MAAKRLRNGKKVDYNALNNCSSADLEQFSSRKRKYRPGSKVYMVERLISKRKLSHRETEYLCKWQDWPLWTCTWEPSNHLTIELMESFENPKIASARIEQAAVTFLDAILQILKSKAVKTTHTIDIKIDHDILRYLFKGRGTLSGDRKSMLYERNDFGRLCLPTYWYYYLNELEEGIEVDFPIKVKSLLSTSKKRFIISNGKCIQAPIFPIERVLITVNRKACNPRNIKL